MRSPGVGPGPPRLCFLYFHQGAERSTFPRQEGDVTVEEP